MIPDQECCDCQSPPSSGCEQSPHQSNNHSLDVVLLLTQGDDPGVTALSLALALGVVRDDLLHFREGHHTETILVVKTQHVTLEQSTSYLDA